MAEGLVAFVVAAMSAVAPFSFAFWQVELDGPDRGELQLPPRVELPPQVELPELEGPDDLNPDDGGGQPPPSEPASGDIDAVDDAAQTTVDAAVRIDFADNDTYREAVQPTITTPPARGDAALGSSVDAHFTYTPDADLGVGERDTFVYAVCSVATPTDCDAATVTVEVISDDAMVPEQSGGSVVEGEVGPTAPALCQEPLQWGGHSNGKIAAAALTEIGGGHRLKTEAADALLAMQQAAAAEGATIGLTDSYRSFEAQVAVRAAKGGIVATARPGTSVHGWGKALDLKVRNPAVRGWLEANSRGYAWINPPWAKRPGKSFEPWHYEFYGTTANPDNPQCAGIGAALTAASDGASEAAVNVGPILPLSAARPVGLGLGALVALVSAAAIFVRDVQRGRSIRERPPS